jgi:hypothetical protein
MRLLANEDDLPPVRWELIFMTFVMIFMFAALISDHVAPDHVFVIAVSFCMVTGVVTIKEGLQGFTNEGVLTVMVRTHACCTSVLLRHIAFCVSWVLYGTPLILKSIRFFSSLSCLGFVRGGAWIDHDRCC